MSKRQNETKDVSVVINTVTSDFTKDFEKAASYNATVLANPIKGKMITKKSFNRDKYKSDNLYSYTTATVWLDGSTGRYLFTQESVTTPKNRFFKYLNVESTKNVTINGINKELRNYTEDIFVVQSNVMMLSSAQILVSDDVLVFKINASDKVEFYIACNENSDLKDNYDLKGKYYNLYELEDDYNKITGKNLNVYSVITGTTDGVKLHEGDTFILWFYKGNFESAYNFLNKTGFVDCILDQYKEISSNNTVRYKALKESKLTEFMLRFSALLTSSMPLPRINIGFIVNGKFISNYIANLDSDGECFISRKYAKRCNIKGHSLQGRPESNKEQCTFTDMVPDIFVKHARKFGGTLLVRDLHTGKMNRYKIGKEELSVTQLLELSEHIEYITDLNCRKIDAYVDEYFEYNTLKIAGDIDKSNNICAQIFQNTLMVSQDKLQQIFAEIFNGVLEDYNKCSLGYSFKQDTPMSAFPVDWSGATKYRMYKSNLDQFTKKLNKGKIKMESRNPIVNTYMYDMYGDLCGMPNYDDNGKVISRLLINFDLTDSEKECLKETDGLVIAQRTPSPGITEGVKFKVTLPNEVISNIENAKDDVKSTIVENIVKDLNCSTDEANMVFDRLIANSIENLKNTKSGVQIYAHDDIKEALGGLDFDTDTMFIVFSPSFVLATKDLFRVHYRDFNSLDKIKDDTLVNFFDKEHLYKQVCESPLRICKGTKSSVGLEVYKIDWIITMYLNAVSASKENNEIAVGMFKALSKKMHFKTGVKASYESPIKYDNSQNELGFQATRTIITVNTFKSVIEEVNNCQVTLENIKKIALDLTIVGCFISDAVIDAAKKLYSVKYAIEVENKIKLNKNICELDTKEQSRGAIKVRGVVSNNAVDKYHVRTLKTVVDYLPQFEVESYKNEECFNIGHMIYSRLNTKQKELLANISAMYSGIVSNYETYKSNFKELLKPLGTALRALVDEDSKVFPLIYYYENRQQSFSTTAFNIAGDYCYDYLYGNGKIRLEIEVDDEDMVDGLILDVDKYDIKNAINPTVSIQKGIKTVVEEDCEYIEEVDIAIVIADRIKEKVDMPKGIINAFAVHNDSYEYITGTLSQKVQQEIESNNFSNNDSISFNDVVILGDINGEVGDAIQIEGNKTLYKNVHQHLCVENLKVPATFGLMFVY